MAKLKYSLTVAAGLTTEKVMFQLVEADLAKDDKGNGKYEGNYEVFPQDDLNVLVNMSGPLGFAWTLEIWMNGEKITPEPIKRKVNELGRADYDGDLNW